MIARKGVALSALGRNSTKQKMHSLFIQNKKKGLGHRRSQERGGLLCYEDGIYSYWSCCSWRETSVHHTKRERDEDAKEKEK
jgi:hypothetical protein